MMSLKTSINIVLSVLGSTIRQKKKKHSVQRKEGKTAIIWKLHDQVY